MSTKVEWRFSSTISGELSVTMNGMTKMQALSAGNSTFQLLVSKKTENRIIRMANVFYNMYTGPRALSEAQFGMGSGLILLDNVRCNGREQRLVDCAHDGVGIHDCSSSEDAGVICVPDGITGIHAFFLHNVCLRIICLTIYRSSCLSVCLSQFAHTVTSDWPVEIPLRKAV